MLIPQRKLSTTENIEESYLEMLVSREYEEMLAALRRKTRTKKFSQDLMLQTHKLVK